MDLAICQVGGDLNEYYRISRFTKHYVNQNALHSSFDCLYDILDDYFVDYRIHDMPWKDAHSKSDRKVLFDEVCELNYNAYLIDNTRSCPVEYFVAMYEDEIQEIYDIAAIIIQKHIRGYITRSKFGVHNPYCEFGMKFLKKMFEIDVKN